MKDVIDNIIKMTVSRVEYSIYAPWNPNTFTSCGTAFIINYEKQKFIMTCAHVASSNAYDIYGQLAKCIIYA